MIRGGGEKELQHTLSMYAVTDEEYERWKDYWAEGGVLISH